MYNYCTFNVKQCKFIRRLLQCHFPCIERISGDIETFNFSIFLANVILSIKPLIHSYQSLCLVIIALYFHIRYATKRSWSRINYGQICTIGVGNSANNSWKRKPNCAKRRANETSSSTRKEKPVNRITTTTTMTVTVITIPSMDPLRTCWNG